MDETISLFSDDDPPGSDSLDPVANAAGIVHDLRQPLNVMLGYADLLESGELGPLNDRMQRALKAMRDKGDEMNVLLEGLLELGRDTEAATMARNTDAINLVDVVQTAADRAQPRATLIGDRVEVEVISTEVPVRAEPRILARLLDNLINNALTHGKHPGRIVVSVRRDGGSGEITVEDDGPGLPEGARRALFSDAQPTSPGTSSHSGAGLGLLLSRGLARRLGGELRYERGTRGARFLITLPLSN